jgi:hypothetical protein
MTDHDAARLAEIREAAQQPDEDQGYVDDVTFLLRLLDARPHDAEFVTRAMYDATIGDLHRCALDLKAAEQRVAELERDQIDKATALDMLTARTADRDRLAAEQRARVAEACIVGLEGQLTAAEQRAAELEKDNGILVDQWADAQDEKRRLVVDRAHGLLARAEAAEHERDKARRWIDQFDCCMCGSRMSGHDIGSGHSPVSMYDYHKDQTEKRAEAAEARVVELQRGWQPIETAPHDRAFDAWAKHRVSGIRTRIPYVKWLDEIGKWWSGYAKQDFEQLWELTHWLPLIEPPQ